MISLAKLSPRFLVADSEETRKERAAAQKREKESNEPITPVAFDDDAISDESSDDE